MSDAELGPLPVLSFRDGSRIVLTRKRHHISEAGKVTTSIGPPDGCRQGNSVLACGTAEVDHQGAVNPLKLTSPFSPRNQEAPVRHASPLIVLAPACLPGCVNREGDQHAGLPRLPDRATAGNSRVPPS